MQRMKRMGQPQEIADVALWMCSDQSTFITGHAMPKTEAHLYKKYKFQNWN